MIVWEPIGTLAEPVVFGNGMVVAAGGKLLRPVLVIDEIPGHEVPGPEPEPEP
jgi:hypothetical protein